MDEFGVAGRRVVVVGGARSGIAAARLLATRGARVTLTDAKQELAGAEELEPLGVTLELGGHDAETLTGAALVVVSPGVKLDQPAIAAARDAGVPVIGELELASRWLRGRVIAITGTKGKSTTTTLAGRMLGAAGRAVLVGGNIGVPLSSQVEASSPGTLHVVEASSFQLETSDSFHPWIAALLNFSPDHLDQHPSVEAYAAAKARIFARQTPDDHAVVNGEDDAALALAAGTRARVARYGIEGGAGLRFTVAGGHVVERTADGERPLVAVSAVRVLGRHILSDVVAAAAIAAIAGAEPGAIAAGVEGFTGLEHAMEEAGRVGGVRFVNDSKATNVASALKSLESAPDGFVAIVGGRYKGGDFRDLRPALAGRARGVVAIGEAAPMVVGALGDLVPAHVAGSMREAVERAYAAARPDGAVVLAPACSSFDMFRDYAERGRRFKEEVAALAARVDPGGSGRER